MTQAAEEVWYRVVDRRCSVADEYGDHAYSVTHVYVDEYRVLRETPKGVWLAGAGPFGQDRFVLRSSRKRWACPTRAEAFESFRARKRRQESILRHQLDHVRQALAKAERQEAANERAG